MTDLPLWERPEMVARFAARKPDHRLIELMQALEPKGLKVLDIGCAAGRNTIYLAELGADVYAIDASNAMLAKSQERLTDLLGKTEAMRRAQFGSMDNLSRFDSDSFDLIIALGVYQDAHSQEMWHKTLTESARVLKVGALCLVANFGPDSQPNAKPLEQLPNAPHQYTGFGTTERTMTLMNQEALDSSFAKVGLLPFKETYTVKSVLEDGFRTTVNALYQKS